MVCFEIAGNKKTLQKFSWKSIMDYLYYDAEFGYPESEDN